MRKRMVLIAVIAAVIFGAATTTALLARGRAELAAAPMADQAPAPQLVAETQSLQSMQSSFREVAKKVLPVVVEINVTAVVKQPAAPKFPFNWFFNQPGPNGQPRSFRESALGSGIIVRHAGDRYYVLTNNHVVSNATEVSVRLNDQRVFKASVVGTDPRKDIAMVSFDSRDTIPVADLGDSGSLQVGDIVLAVGNPFGFESTLTMGIVSALGRRSTQGDVSSYTDYIQTDAAINQGNSGGALVNVQGQVVGINTWIAAPTGGNIGLGFAIPINNARTDIDSFLTTGKVTYGWLGVQIADVQDANTYPGFARDLKVEGVPGAMALNVYKGSPADKAGILPGDYVTRVDTTNIQGSDQLTQVVGGLAAGKTYPFSIIRGGAKMNLPVTIGVRDPNDNVAQYKNLWPGMTVVNLTDQVRQEANIPQAVQGVVVGYLPDQDTPVSIAGFKVGDVISGINGQSVRNVLDFYKALNDRSKNQLSFRVEREGTEIVIGITR
jgi:serine protease Do